MIKWRPKRRQRNNFDGLDPIKSKIGAMLDWTTRAEYYHANWVRESVGPFKATAELVNAMKIGPDDIVLDLACGTGAVSRNILCHLTRGILVGVDLSQTALSIAKSWTSSSNGLSDCLLIQMDAESLGFRKIFSKVACQFALSFFPDAKEALGQLTKVMKSPSILGVVVHGQPEMVPYLSAISEPVSKFMPGNISRALQHVYRFGRREDLMNVLIDGGFHDISISELTFEYQAGSFEDYWSGYFLNGYGNAFRSIILNNNNRDTISKIKLASREIASCYDVDGIIRFPWRVLLATACL